MSIQYMWYNTYVFTINSLIYLNWSNNNTFFLRSTKKVIFRVMKRKIEPKTKEECNADFFLRRKTLEKSRSGFLLITLHNLFLSSEEFAVWKQSRPESWLVPSVREYIISLLHGTESLQKGMKIIFKKLLCVALMRQSTFLTSNVHFNNIYYLVLTDWRTDLVSPGTSSSYFTYP